MHSYYYISLLSKPYGHNLIKDPPYSMVYPRIYLGKVKMLLGVLGLHSNILVVGVVTGIASVRRH